MRKGFALVAVLVLALAGPGHAASAGHAAQACGATRAALEWMVADYPKGPLWLETDTHPFIPADPADPSMRWGAAGASLDAPRLTAGPSKALTAAFSTQRRLVSAARCGSVLHFAHELGLKVGPSPRGHPLLRKPDGDSFAYRYVDMTRAVVSPDGTEALVYLATASGRADGGASLILLRREPGGHWKVTGIHGLYVA